MPITRNRRRKIAGGCAKPSELQATKYKFLLRITLFSFNPSRQSLRNELARLLFAYGTEIHVGGRWYGRHRPISPASGRRPTVWWHLPYPITHQQKPLRTSKLALPYADIIRYYRTSWYIKNVRPVNITIDFLTFRGSFAILISWPVSRDQGERNRRLRIYEFFGERNESIGDEKRSDR